MANFQARDWRVFTKQPKDDVSLSWQEEQIRRRQFVCDEGIIAHADRLIVGKTVLDVGMVGHHLSCQEDTEDLGFWRHARIRQLARECWGIDVVEEEIEKLKSWGFDNLYCCDAESDLYLGRQFEVIYLGDVIEHVGSPLALLRFCLRHLTDSGVILVTTPNPFCFQYIAETLLQHGAPVTNAEHTCWISPTNALEIGNRLGLTLEGIGLQMPGWEKTFKRAFTAPFRMFVPPVYLSRHYLYIFKKNLSVQEKSAAPKISITEPPLVTVVTPSFNQAEFLEQTIQSVLAQDYPRIEYIVVDGGSTDGSRELIRKYESRLAKWISEPDRGQSDAINKGFRLASGRLVAFLNSDDLYFPHSVSTAVKRFQDNQELALLYGQCVFIDRDGQFKRYFTEIEKYSRFRLLNCSNFIMQPATFFRRDRLFEVGLLNEDLTYTMDYDLWCRFANCGYPIHYEEQVLAANRDYSGTKTTSGRWARMLEIWKIQRQYRTSLWPHAFFGFLAKEFEANLIESQSGPHRMGFRFLRRVAQLGAIQNWLHKRRIGRDLYGYQHYSQACHRRVRFILPVYLRPQSFVLEVEVPFAEAHRHPQSLSVTINDEHVAAIDFAGDPAARRLHLPLPASVEQRHVLDLHLTFSREYTNYGYAGYLRRLELRPEPAPPGSEPVAGLAPAP